MAERGGEAWAGAWAAKLLTRSRYWTRVYNKYSTEAFSLPPEDEDLLETMPVMALSYFYTGDLEAYLFLGRTEKLFDLLKEVVSLCEETKADSLPGLALRRGQLTDLQYRFSVLLATAATYHNAAATYHHILSHEAELLALRDRLGEFLLARPQLLAALEEELPQEHYAGLSGGRP